MKWAQIMLAMPLIAIGLAALIGIVALIVEIVMQAPLKNGLILFFTLWYGWSAARWLSS